MSHDEDSEAISRLSFVRMRDFGNMNDMLLNHDIPTGKVKLRSWICARFTRPIMKASKLREEPTWQKSQRSRS